MKRKSSRICGRKTTTEPTPPQTPSRRSDLSRDAGRSARQPRPRRRHGAVDDVHERPRRREDRLEDRDDDDEEDERPRDGMQEDRVEPARPDRRRGSGVARLVPHRGRPLPALRNVGRTGRSRDAGTPTAPLEKLAHHLEPLAPRRAHERDRRPELRRERLRVDVAAAARQLVGHVQDDEGRKPERENGSREDEMPLQVRRVEDQEHGVGLRHALHLALEDVVRHPLVLRARRQAVDARQVDRGRPRGRPRAAPAAPLLHGDAGKVRDLLPQPGEPVEERRLARVRRAHEGDEARRPRGRRERRMGGRVGRVGRPAEPARSRGVLLSRPRRGGAAPCRAGARTRCRPPGRRADRLRARSGPPRRALPARSRAPSGASRRPRQLDPPRTPSSPGARSARLRGCLRLFLPFLRLSRIFDIMP